MYVVLDEEYELIVDDTRGRECGGNIFWELIGSRGYEGDLEVD